MSKANWKSSGWVNRFWFALENNDQRTIKSMISHGINVNHKFMEHGHKRQTQTPIFIAVSKNNKELVNILIQSGADVDHADMWGETPVFLSVRQGKLPMLKCLIKAKCNINHQNKRGESVLFLAIKWGRLDLLDEMLASNANCDLINKEGSSPLILAFELYENYCTSKRATRRSAPSNIGEIIQRLIPFCSSLNHQHPNKGSALRVALTIETQYFPLKLEMAKKLMQHGAIPDRLFFLRYGGLNASTAQEGAEFFTRELFALALNAGAKLQREKVWLITVLQEMPQELDPYQQLFMELLEISENPRSLQSICQSTVRGILGGRLWEKIDLLPLPQTLKDYLKLKIS